MALEKSEAKTWTVERDGERNLKFAGWELAGTDNMTMQGPGQNRYSMMTLWLTCGGKYVIQTSNISHWQGERNQTSADIFDTIEELIEEITAGGVSDIVKRLIEEAATRDKNFVDALVEEIE